MDITDEAFNTLNLLRNATWLEDDMDIETVIKELAQYFVVNPDWVRSYV